MSAGAWRDDFAVNDIDIPSKFVVLRVVDGIACDSAILHHMECTYSCEKISDRQY
jgi:hypothetical protein